MFTHMSSFYYNRYIFTFFKWKLIFLGLDLLVILGTLVHLQCYFIRHCDTVLFFGSKH